MYTKESYFCKYPDGKAIWYAPDAEIKPGYIEKTERLMLYPETGKVLQNKITGATSAGCWVQESELENWTEIDQKDALEMFRKADKNACTPPEPLI